MMKPFEVQGLEGTIEPLFNYSKAMFANLLSWYIRKSDSDAADAGCKTSAAQDYMTMRAQPNPINQLSRHRDQGSCFKIAMVLGLASIN